MCFAEAYHEVCMVLSFIPIIFSIWWGEVWVFFWTSLGGAVFDSLFVLIQRFNRPRVLKYYNRTKIDCGLICCFTDDSTAQNYIVFINNY